MPIDDDVINTNIIKLSDTINKSGISITELKQLRDAFTSIQKTERRVDNNNGGFDIVEKAPNPNNLSEEDLIQVRQILYDNCLERFSKLEF